MSLRFPPASVSASGSPAAYTSRWCLEPVRARSTDEDPVRPPSKGAGVLGGIFSWAPVIPAAPSALHRGLAAVVVVSSVLIIVLVVLTTSRRAYA